jgi:hypothetical protein
MVNYAPSTQATVVPSNPGDPDVLFWTDYANRNCYAYALNYTDQKSFNPGALAPGKAINHAHLENLNEITDFEFRALCEADGLTWIGPVLIAPGAAHYTVALYRANRGNGPLGDYHWARQDSAGNWSHKQKTTLPSTHDLSEGSGQPIVSPTTAAMNFVSWASKPALLVCAYNFTGYFHVPKAGLRNRSVSGCCLIATASFEAMGVGEDCEELELLRWFRDSVVEADAAGRRQVAAYYAAAPLAVANIRARPDAAEIFAVLHRDHIAPAIEAVRAGAHTKARDIFTNALTDVLPRFL